MDVRDTAEYKSYINDDYALYKDYDSVKYFISLKDSTIHEFRFSRFIKRKDGVLESFIDSYSVEVQKYSYNLYIRSFPEDKEEIDNFVLKAKKEIRCRKVQSLLSDDIKNILDDND